MEAAAAVGVSAAGTGVDEVSPAETAILRWKLAVWQQYQHVL
ncbi:RER1A protein, partial [Trifolium medium]|nr:RER1A protein [Trifolium medium]